MAGLTKHLAARPMTYGVPLGLYVSSWLIWALVGPTAEYLPSLENITTLLLCLLLADYIRSSYVRYVVYFWCLWFVLGTLSLYAINIVPAGRNYNLDASVANRFYLLSILAVELGALASQSMVAKWALAGRVGRPHRADGFVTLFLLLTPLLYAMSVIQATGDIPLLSGRILSAQMYEEDYGFFHRFGIYVAIAALLLWTEILKRRTVLPFRISTITCAVLIVAMLFVGMMDGRRAFTIFALNAMLMYYLVNSASFARYLWVALLSVMGLASYVVAEAVRSGKTLGMIFQNGYALLSTFGLEYRDFVYSFDRFSRESVLGTGYDWLGSTAVNFVPSFLVGLVGLDKTKLATADSARSLMELYDVELGIRIGLPGEIWLAYGWFGLLLFIPFGFLVSWVAYRAAVATDPVTRSIWLMILSLWGLAVLGQSTVTFGLLLPLFYLAMFNTAVRSLSGGTRRRAVSVR